MTLNEIPILLIIFNKLNETKTVFGSIKKLKPKKLYISADGPRRNILGEQEKCKAIRKWVFDNIDWDCEVNTFFREENVGCGRGPSEAISWFFENVNEGIILEDDCLPNDSFFRFCEVNLAKYRDNSNISIISGNNFQPAQPLQIDADYYFSVFPSTWGWATWKRTWDGYEYILPLWEKKEERKLEDFIFKDNKYSQWWINFFYWMQKEKPDDMWDFQFYFHCMKNRQLAIIPKANLVSNIGFGEMATHTTGKDSYFSNMPSYELHFPLKHPKKIERYYEADVFVQKTLFGEAEIKTLKKRFKHYIKQIIPFKL